MGLLKSELKAAGGELEAAGREMQAASEGISAGSKFELDNTFINGVDNLMGNADLGWYTGYTANFEISAILKQPGNNVSGSVIDNLVHKTEAVAKSAGLSEVRIEFQTVVNPYLEHSEQLAKGYGFHYYRYKTETGAINVEWTKTIKQ